MVAGATLAALEYKGESNSAIQKAAKRFQRTFYFMNAMDIIIIGSGLFDKDMTTAQIGLAALAIGWLARGVGRELDRYLDPIINKDK